MKKFNMPGLKSISTLMSTTTAHDSDENGEAVNQREYRSMIGSLLYLTITRPYIQFTVCLCARFQASRHTSHWQVVQQIFKYLKSTLKFGIWDFAYSSLDFVGFFMLILWVVELTKKACLVQVISLVLLLFVGLLANNLLLHNPSHRPSM
jgi:hypothetical protein